MTNEKNNEYTTLEEFVKNQQRNFNNMNYDEKLEHHAREATDWKNYLGATIFTAFTLAPAFSIPYIERIVSAMETYCSQKSDPASINNFAGTAALLLCFNGAFLGGWSAIKLLNYIDYRRYLAKERQLKQGETK